MLEGPPSKKHAGLTSFLDDVALDEKFSNLLIKLRKGSPTARKQALRDLSETEDCVALVEAALPMLKEPGLPELERQRLVSLLCRVLQRQPALGITSPLCGVVRPFLETVKFLLNSHDQNVRTSEALPLLLAVARVVGMKSYITALRPSFCSEDEATRQSNATCIAAAGCAFGISLTLPLIKVLVKSEHVSEKKLGLQVVQRLPGYLGSATLQQLPHLVGVCSSFLADPQLSNTSNAALTALAEAVSPLGFEAFKPAMEPLWTGARRRKGRSRIPFLRTLAALVPLAQIENHAAEIADPVLNLAVECLKEPAADQEELRRALNVAKGCVAHVSANELDRFIRLFFDLFWEPWAASDRRLASLVVRTAVELPLEPKKLVEELVATNTLVSHAEELQFLCLSVLSRMKPGLLLLDRRSEERLVDGLMSALPDAATPNMDGDDKSGLVDVGNSPEGGEELDPRYRMLVSVKAISKVMQSLPGDRANSYAKVWVHTLLMRDRNPSPQVRQNALKILASLAATFPQIELLYVYRRLNEELGEEFPAVLQEVMTALDRVIFHIDLENIDLDPPVSQLLPMLTPILRNRNEHVQESCVKLIRQILDIAGESISAKEWMHICFELLDLQKSQRQQLRYEATKTFAAISAVIGPADVVAMLINHLRSPDRQLRVTTAAAIASVAVETGPFTVIPVLVNEYSKGDVVIQQGVLKSLSFLFEFIDKNKGVNYYESIATLVDDSLTDKSQVHRQTAAAVVHHMAEGAIGSGKEALFYHFLNELMPSIFETSPHVIDRVVDAINSIRSLIGAAAFSNYLWAGLFHPARKVRNIYWRLWNLLKADDSDALVPALPTYIPDPLGNEGGDDIRDVWL